MAVDHPRGSHPSLSALRLYGRRILLRPLNVSDFAAWSDVRRRNHDWLTPWEPARPIGAVDPAGSRDAFSARCTARDRDRATGAGYAFGLFVDASFAGEVNLANIQRGPIQTGTIGYWIDRDRAGHGYVAEGVVVLLGYAFDELRLHRLEVCIVPRNANSRRVAEKLGLRDEGVAVRMLEINGTWEDHIRYAITAEEWQERREELTAAWLRRGAIGQAGS
jgi:ribosomal-protein-alanine N-acetyltransferase